MIITMVTAMIWMEVTSIIKPKSETRMRNISMINMLIDVLSYSKISADPRMLEHV